jgi:hypothetical protein
MYMTPEKTKLTKIEEIRVLAEGAVGTMVLDVDVTGLRRARSKGEIAKIVGTDGLTALAAISSLQPTAQLWVFAGRDRR